MVYNDKKHMISLFENNLLINNSNNKFEASAILNIQFKLSITHRQAECLYYLFRGKTAKQIAKILNLSYRTIEYYIENLKNKFDCKNRTELIDLLFP